MRLLTVAFPDGSTAAAYRNGDVLEAFIRPEGGRYADAGALLRDGLDGTVIEPLAGTPEADALAHIAGVTLMNDVSMRDFQYRSLQWFAGKSWHASTPVGPEIVTLDELEDLGARELRTTVGGEVRQRATVDDLIFGIPELVADISRIIELSPGDLIATGTPGGVGHAMEPPRYLAPGDVVEVSLSGVGTLRTTFTADT